MVTWYCFPNKFQLPNILIQPQHFLSPSFPKKKAQYNSQFLFSLVNIVFCFFASEDTHIFTLGISPDSSSQVSNFTFNLNPLYLFISIFQRMEPSQLRLFSGTFHPASKSIPLEKYSSAVSREGSRSHRWVHDTRKDLLTLVFKPVDISIDDGRTETRLFMTVTAGRDTLVSLSPLSPLEIGVDALLSRTCFVQHL